MYDEQIQPGEPIMLRLNEIGPATLMVTGLFVDHGIEPDVWTMRVLDQSIRLTDPYGDGTDWTMDLTDEVVSVPGHIVLEARRPISTDVPMAKVMSIEAGE